MATFNVNQNNQWFTVMGVEDPQGTPAAGDIVVKTGGGKKWLLYNHYNQDNEIDSTKKKYKRSEIIERLMYIKYTPVEAFPKRNRWTVTFSGTPTAGETYVMTVTAPQFHGLGEYLRESFGVTYTATTTSTGANMMQSFANDLNDHKDLVGTNGFVDISVSGTTITIEEKAEQKWRRGAMFNDYVTILDFSFLNVNTGVDHSGDFTVTHSTTNSFTYKNSQEVADMEYFYLGEHGDQQRDYGFPYNLHKPNGYYKVNDTSTDGYDIIEIHHCYVGNGTFVHKSEMSITIAMPAGNSTDNNLHAVASDVIGKLNSEWSAGLSTNDLTVVQMKNYSE